MIDCLLIGDVSLLVRCGEMLRTAGVRIAGVVTDDAAVSTWATGVGAPVERCASALAVPPDPASVDYVFSIGNLHVLPSAWLTVARRAVVNFHDGPLPEYRGLYTTTWALAHHETHHGVTWHLVTAALDAGDIVEQQRFAIEPDDTAFTLNARCFAAGAAAFERVVAAILGGTLTWRPQPTDVPSRYFGRRRRPAGAGYVDWRHPIEAEALVRALDFGPYVNPLCLPWSWRDGAVVRVDRATAASVAAGSERFDPIPEELTARLTARHEAWGITEAAWLDRLRSPLPLPLGPATDARRFDVAASFALPEVPPDQRAAAILVWFARAFDQPVFDVACRGPALDRDVAGLEPWFEPLPPLRLTVPFDAPFAVAVAGVAAALADHDRAGSFLHDLRHRYPELRGQTGATCDPDHALAVTIGEDAASGLDHRAALVIHLTTDGSHCDWRAHQGRLPVPLATLQERCAAFILTAAARPTTPVADLPLVTDAERAALTAAARGPALTAPFVAWPDRLDACAAATPDATAVATGRASWSHGELARRAARITAALRRAGVGRGAVIGLHLGRSVGLLAAIVGVARAGAAFLPLDPTYPRARLGLMLEDSGAALVLVDGPADGTALDSAVPRLSLAEVFADSTLDGAEAAGQAPPLGPDDIAYLIYTSGSTGRPKGVVVTHGNVSSFFAAMDQQLDADAPAAWLAVTSLSFDISVLELLWTVSRGVTVVLREQPAGAAAPPRPPLSFSLFYFAADESVESADRYRLLLEGARFADHHGFEAVWTPERHFHAFGGLYPNPSVTSAALAVVTERVHLRAGSVVLPLHHPARVAEEWSVVDNLSRGRVGIAFASGWHPGDFLFAPERHASAKAATFELIDVVRRLWRGEPVRFPGPGGTDLEVRTLPRPVQSELPFWITSAGNPETFRRAGAVGANVLTHLLGQTVDELAANISEYRRARAAGGHRGPGRVTLMVHTFVGDSDAEVRDLTRGPMTRYLGSALDLVKPHAWSFPAFKARAGAAHVSTDELFRGLSDGDQAALLDHAFNRYFEHGALFGSIDTCAAMVERLRDAGVDEIACLIDFGVPTERALAGLVDLARLRTRVASPPGVERSIAESIVEYGITHLQCTPSLAELILAEPGGAAALGRLRHLLVGGETLPAPLATRLLATGVPRLTNMYGPTETTIWSLTHDVREGEAPVPIGRPIAGTHAYVCDRHGDLVPTGAEGELWIGGPGVARGYHRQPDATAQRFVADRFALGTGRLYRTGDRVRRRADGAIEFLGRADDQVKLRGHRLELGEVEAALRAVPGVGAAAAVVREDTPGDRRLVAYVTAAPGRRLAAEECRRTLAARLPAAMVPAVIVVLDALPTTPNGKLDRRSLPPPAGGVPRAATPATDLQRTVAAVWQELLGVADVGLDDNFFDLGGHSLLTLQAAQRLGTALGRTLPITDFFRYPTVRALATHLGAAAPDGATVRTAAEVRAARRRAARGQGR